MTELALTTLGDLVAESPARARALEALGLDYCCGGQRTLRQACAEKGLSEQLALAALARVDERPEPAEVDLRAMNAGALCDLIVDTHHVYLRREMPRLAALADKVASVHGANHPELVDVQRIYAAFQDEMYAHLSKEENILFPLIKRLAARDTAGGFHCGSVMNPIRVMLMEHDGAGAALQQMRDLTNGFEVPEDGCTSYAMLLSGLRELEQDTHRHIHKENNVLFLKAAALQEEVA